MDYKELQAYFPHMTPDYYRSTFSLSSSLNSNFKSFLVYIFSIWSKTSFLDAYSIHSKPNFNKCNLTSVKRSKHPTISIYKKMFSSTFLLPLQMTCVFPLSIKSIGHILLFITNTYLHILFIKFSKCSTPFCIVNSLLNAKRAFCPFTLSNVASWYVFKIISANPL